MNKKLLIVGYGSVFDLISRNPDAYGFKSKETQLFKFNCVREIAAQAESIIESIDFSALPFVAVDEYALNFARLELFGRGMLRGVRFINLIHCSAIIDPSVQFGSNVFVGPGCIIGPNCRIGSNTLINSGSRIDGQSVLGDHIWIGSGCKIESSVRIGKNTVLASDQKIRSHVDVGRYCYLDKADIWSQPVPDGTFFESIYAEPAIMIGRGYSWHR